VATPCGAHRAHLSSSPCPALHCRAVPLSSRVPAGLPRPTSAHSHVRCPRQVRVGHTQQEKQPDSGRRPGCQMFPGRVQPLPEAGYRVLPGRGSTALRSSARVRAGPLVAMFPFCWHDVQDLEGSPASRHPVRLRCIDCPNHGDNPDDTLPRVLHRCACARSSCPGWCGDGNARNGAAAQSRDEVRRELWALRPSGTCGVLCRNCQTSSSSGRTLKAGVRSPDLEMKPWA
jgi:hypothetical protein